MSLDIVPAIVHPAGSQLPVAPAVATAAPLNTFAGPVKVAWDPESALTPHGQLVYFAEFLKASGRWTEFVESCPLTYTSGNAPGVVDMLGTWVLSILAGHRRYAHVTALRADEVLPELFGMEKIVSEDALRRALQKMPEDEGLEWLQKQFDAVTHPLLGERYIIDIDTTVKPLYGHQQGTVVSYNLKKPGRPSHVHHTYMMAGVRRATPCFSPASPSGHATAARRCCASRARTVAPASPSARWPASAGSCAGWSGLRSS